MQKIIKLNGYFLSSIDSVLRKNKKYTVYINFQEKVDSVQLKYTNGPTLILKKYNFKDKPIKVPYLQRIGYCSTNSILFRSNALFIIISILTLKQLLIKKS